MTIAGAASTISALTVPNPKLSTKAPNIFCDGAIDNLRDFATARRNSDNLIRGLTLSTFAQRLNRRFRGKSRK
ncbi:MAG: hypothetical protein AUI16_06455 [Alphaproteobacteria bacterium 13_2_20CM_2_64_7]|nr:MAG: hypothetical protein AUI16_06455 [Alphaproteobacteria bacterium 13_2_20CM_2_64_7]